MMHAEDLHQADSVDVQIWSVDRLVAALEERGQEVIFRPSFQRGLVWDSERQTRLIESIKSQYPVGSLLLFRSGYEQNRVVYELVDGLQRSCSLLEYVNNAPKFFQGESIDDAFLDEMLRIFDVIPAKDRDGVARWKYDLKKVTVNWMRSCVGFAPADGFSAVKLAGRFAQAFGHPESHINLPAVQACESFLETVRRELDIGEYKMPVIVFSGNRTKLPEIFERLNTGGVMLNKYDILGSCWDGVTVKLTNNAVIDAAIDRLEIINDAVPISGRKAIDRSSGNLEFFDLICGLGAVLSTQYPELFPPPSKKKEGEPASHGFTLVALCFLVDTKKDKDFRELPKRVATLGNADEFIAKILDAAKLLNEALRPLAGIRIDIEKGGPYHKELQMASMVASFYRAYGPKPLAHSRVTLGERAKNMVRHYLADQFRSYWSGTGDTKSLKAVRDDAYEQSVSARTFASYLSSWYLEIVEGSKATKKLDPKASLFLKAYAAASGIRPTDGPLVAAPALHPQIVTPLGIPANMVANLRLAKANGKVIADVGDHVAPLPRTPTRHDIELYLKRRFTAMLDLIVAHFGFQD